MVRSNVEVDKGGTRGMGRYGMKDVPRVVLVKVCSMVMGTTSETTTTWVLPMLSYTTVAR